MWFFALFALDSIAVAAQSLVPTAMASEGLEQARFICTRLLQRPRHDFGGLCYTVT